MKHLNDYILERGLFTKNNYKSNKGYFDEDTITQWVYDNFNVYGDISIENGKIIVDGSIYLANRHLSSFVYEFDTVKGDFCCNRSDISSLQGCPQSVGGSFDCSNTKITSLKGSPRSVEGDFIADFNNHLKTLKGGPDYVGGFFNCSRCLDLVSLEGSPKTICGSFYCYLNKKLTSLKGAPTKVESNFVCYSCGKEFTADDISNRCTVEGNIVTRV